MPKQLTPIGKTGRKGGGAQLGSLPRGSTPVVRSEPRARPAASGLTAPVPTAQSPSAAAGFSPGVGPAPGRRDQIYVRFNDGREGWITHEQFDQATRQGLIASNSPNQDLDTLQPPRKTGAAARSEFPEPIQDVVDFVDRQKRDVESKLFPRLDAPEQTPVETAEPGSGFSQLDTGLPTLQFSGGSAQPGGPPRPAGVPVRIGEGLGVEAGGPVPGAGRELPPGVIDATGNTRLQQALQAETTRLDAEAAGIRPDQVVPVGAAATPAIDLTAATGQVLDVPPPQSAGPGSSPDQLGDPILDEGIRRQDEFRDAQGRSIADLFNAAQGLTPSVAELQGRRQMQQVIRGQHAASAGARGLAGALARRQAASQAARLATDATGQAQIARAREMADARQALTAALGQARGQDLDVAGIGADIGRAELDTRTRLAEADLAARTRLQEAQLDAALKRMGIQADLLSSEQKNQLIAALQAQELELERQKLAQGIKTGDRNSVIGVAQGVGEFLFSDKGGD